MHALAAVAGQLVKDRQMLPDRDFPARWKLAHIFGAILMLVRCLWRSGQSWQGFSIVRMF